MIPEKFTGLILFSAPWAADSCRSAKQIIETARSRRGTNDNLIEVEESEGSESIFDAIGIEAVPCLVRMREGREVRRVVGVDSKLLLQLISGDSVNADNSVSADNSASTYAAASTNAATTNTVNSARTVSDKELEALVNQSSLMLFIKGTPEEPRCGFTTQLIRLLSANGLDSDIHYRTFNILEDELVRARLKEWAKWPTFPQIYWKGELVGGLDILKEMFANNQMEEIINELKGLKN